MDQEGYWKECPKCHGKGTVPQTTGFFTVTTTDEACPCCNGEKKICYSTTCPLMSGMYFGYCEHHENYNRDCIGSECSFWDREGDGGCLIRKAMLKQVRG